jgi:hypothetical protein
VFLNLGSGQALTLSGKAGVEILWLDENRYAVTIDGIVRYVGTLEECERRAAILTPKNDRAAQDRALGRLTR